MDVSLNIASVRAPLHRHESLPPPPPLLPLRFVSGGFTSRRLFASLRSGHRPLKGGILTGVITLRTFVSSGLTSRRRFASLRSGRLWQRSHPFLTSPFGRHPHCNPALLKKISSLSSSFPCLVSRFLLRFYLVLKLASVLFLLPIE